ncbi:MAG TPA: glycosyltransferase family 2 protein [Stenomitos sp.]
MPTVRGDIKVVAYITAYEDWEAVDRCLYAIQKQTFQVTHILIVDNSSKNLIPTRFNLLEEITVQSFPENIGISGGLKVAVEWFKKSNYDFLWTFDQDSEPEPDCLEKLIFDYNQLISQNIPVGVIAPLPIDNNTQMEICGRNFENYHLVSASNHKGDLYECDVVITSGSLIPIKAAQSVELPNGELFIDAVDWEYCINFKTKGYKIFVSKKAILKHQFSDLVKVKIPLLGANILINNYSPLRQYYICRNHTYFIIKNTSNNYLLLSFLSRIYYALRVIFKVAFYEPDQKLQKISACLLGTFDGFRGKLGKTW